MENPLKTLVFPGFFAFRALPCALGAARILRSSRGSCAVGCAVLFRCLGEMIFSHLEVVLRGDAFGVADPGADDVNRIGLCQFRLPSRAKVLPEFRPRLQTCPADYARELGPKVRAAISVATADVISALSRQLKSRCAPTPSAATVAPPIQPALEACDQLFSDYKYKNCRKEVYVNCLRLSVFSARNAMDSKRL